MNRVKGKIAIVTGGASGLGEASAQSLIKEGAIVMLTDIQEDRGQAVAKSLGSNAKFMRHDVTKESEWKKVIKETESALGPINILLNSAGIADHCSLEDYDEAQYHRVIAINQDSVFLGMKTVAASMKRAGGGAIINMSSVCGLIGVPNCIAYVASKFAVRGMSKAAAVELAQYNIRVNSIHPGYINTPINKVTADNEGGLTAAKAATPLNRIGQPEEIANVVLMLASDESTFMTGSEITIDGGMTSI